MDDSSWRWCFYINLPVGAITIITTFLFFNADGPKKTKGSLFNQLRQLDPLGLFFFVPSITCLILALEWAGSTYAWSDPVIIGLMVTFAVTFVIFVVVEVMTPATAMAPPKIVTKRSIVASLTFMFTSSGAMMVIVYYLAIWFQVVKGDSALDAGIHSIPLVLSLVLSGIPAAAFTQKIGYYVPVMLLGPIPASIGAGMLSTMSPDSPIGQWIGFQILYGLGVGCAFQATSLVAQTVLPRKDVPIGIALGFFMQQIGGSVFIAIAQNIFASTLVSRLDGVGGLDAQSIINGGATSLHSVVPDSELGFVLDAYNHALTLTFILAAALSAASFVSASFVEWKSIKGGKETQPSSDEADGGEKGQSSASVLDGKLGEKDTVIRD